MKQNKNTCIKISSFLLAAIVLVLSISVPAFAADNFSQNQYSFDDEDQPVSIGMGSYNTLPVIGTTSLGDGSLKVWSRYHTIQAYMFQYMNSSGTPVIVYCNAKSNYSPSGDEVRYYPGSNNYIGSQNFSVYSNILTNADYWYCTYTGYAQGGSWGTYTLNLPLYSNLNDGLQNFLDFMEDGGFAPEVGLNYSLPAGNVAFIDITNRNVTFDLSIYGTALGWNTNAIQYYGTVNEIPSSFEIPLSGTSIINWSGTGKSDFLGRYSNWTYSGTVSGSASGHNHVYLVVVNPLSQLATNNSDGTIGATGGNPNINIHTSSYNGIRVFNLKETYSYGTPAAESSGKTYTGYTDEDGNLYFVDDETGNVESPAYGGDNLVDNNAKTISEWLEHIANTIGSFFRGAIGAVSTLVASGSEFMHTVAGLYSWLPAPVYSVLTSAIILVITIGVIKVFI